jgi:hypothetical protein
MIRRITLRAGVVKLSHDFYALAWECVIQTILSILIPACHRAFQLDPRLDIWRLAASCGVRRRN